MARVLIVDDMAIFRDPISALLRSRGHETFLAGNGREALACLEKHAPDLVLLDVTMPVMNGLEYLQAVKANPQLPSPPVILLTAIAERDYVVQAAALGVRDYLLKSAFSVDELVRRIDKALGAGDGTATAPASSASPTASARATTAAPAATAAPATATGPRAPAAASNTTASTPTAASAPHDAGDAHDPAAAIRSLKPLMTRSQIQERVEACGELKPFSPSLARLLALTANPNSSSEQIAKAIKQDHALALKILKLANSSVYTRGEPVESVDRAVTRIGQLSIRQAILNLGVVDGLGEASVGTHTDAGSFWEHSIACGLIAAELARHRKDGDPDRSFTMGLVHDVGRLMYAQQLGEIYDKVVHAARSLDLPLEVVESRLLLLNHADCMDRLLHHWKFPRDLIDPIVFHHLSVENIKRIAPRRAGDVAVLALANRLAHAMLLGSSGNETIYSTDEFCRTLELGGDVVREIERTIPEETTNLKLALLSRASGATAWIDRRAQCRDALPGFRPLFVGESPDHDAFRIVCDTIAGPGEGPPNVAVVHLRDDRSAHQLGRRLRRAETEAALEPLPALLISATGNRGLDQDAMAGRTAFNLTAPMTVTRLMQALGSLLKIPAVA